MVSTLQDRLLEIFTAIAGEQTRFPEGSTDAAPRIVHGGPTRADENATSQPTGMLPQPSYPNSAEGVVVQPAKLSRETLQQSVAMDAVNSTLTSSLTAALWPAGGVLDAVRQASEGGGVVNTLESIASKVFTSGFGLVSLFGDVFGLFGGGEQQEPPPLVKYALPPRIDIQAAGTAGGIVQMDYGQTGQPRGFGSELQRTGNSGAPAITVNVQALDARSFLDRSSEIAAAVRDAMLNLNSINDVVNDL